MNLNFLVGLILSIFVVSVFSDVLEINKCNKGSDANAGIGELQELDVVPCEGAANGDPCVFLKNSTATIKATFKAFEPVGKRKRRVRGAMYWMNGFMDLPFSGMNTKACQSMDCSFKANDIVTYEQDIFMSPDLPSGSYPVKFKIFKGRKNYFCTMFHVKLED